MPCSSTYLFIDLTLWMDERVSSTFIASYRNLSEGDAYDCALSSAPCNSNFTNSLISLDPNKVFWSDVLLVYVVLSSVFCLGIFGNICNMIILSRNNIASDSTNNLLLATSASDFLYSLSVGVNLIHNYLCFFDNASAISAYNATSLGNYFVAKMAGLLSLDFITVMSIQRAVAVVFPFKIGQIFSFRNTNIIIAVLILIYLLSALPLVCTTIPRLVFHPFFGKHIFLGYNFYIDYSTILVGVYQPFYMIRTVLNLFLLITFVSVTIHNLKKHVRNRSNLKAGKSSTAAEKDDKASAMSDREIKVVQLSAAVCYVSFAVYFIECSSSVLHIFYRNELFTSFTTIIINFFAKISGALGCSFNFILYLTMSAQFRGIFIGMFSFRKNSKPRK